MRFRAGLHRAECVRDILINNPYVRYRGAKWEKLIVRRKHRTRSVVGSWMRPSPSLRRGGDAAITVDAVARRAGVSKGGFQHHFPTRKALIEAVLDQIWARFQAHFEASVAEDEEPVGRLSRAYLLTNDHAHTEEMRLDSRAALALTLSDADCRRRWSERTAELLPDDEASTLEGRARLLICRLAADGLWLAELLGIQAPTAELRAEMMRQLEDITRRT